MNLETKTITVRTADEIEALKANWRNNPIWDIEDTEGFELHRDELLAYRLENETLWKKQQERKIVNFATALGIENNLALAQYLMEQDAILTDLGVTVDQIQKRLPYGK